MKIGIATLVLGYGLSQFYRAFLAVLVPVLERDLGATKADLAAASGWWFLGFALAQIPVGWALDRLGPRRTTAALLGIAAVGAAVFATASGPRSIQIAMGLIGVGCASVLMAAYVIFARTFPPAVFATLAGASIGIGSLGNIAAALPLSAAVEAFGWRPTIWGLAGLTALVAVSVGVLVRDPPRAGMAGQGSLLDLIRLRALWPILAMMAVCYTPAAALRGLWVGPWFTDIHGATAEEVGVVSLWIGVAMLVANFAYGPLDRVFGTRKGVILAGNAVVVACLFAMALLPVSATSATLLLVAIGGFGATFPMVVAHGRAFIPAHLTGRGITLLNLAGIAPIGLAQLATGRLFAATPPDPPEAPFQAVFLFLAVMTAAGLAAYALSRDRTD